MQSVKRERDAVNTCWVISFSYFSRSPCCVRSVLADGIRKTCLCCGFSAMFRPRFLLICPVVYMQWHSLNKQFIAKYLK